ncbi:MAG: DUF6624 domain-containing protein [Pseudomonadota bacterium]
MLASLIFAAALAGATPSLSPEAFSAIAPVVEAIAQERAAQAKLPPPKDDREKLIRLSKLDQAPRMALRHVDFSKAPAAEVPAAKAALTAALKEVDALTEAEVMRMVPPEGWFARSRYGEDGERAAFLIIQHSSIENWRRFLPVIERFVAKGEASGESYALMYDRVAITDKRPQRFGSQLRCEGGKLVPYPLEDPARVEAWRKEMGMPFTYAEQLANLSKVKVPC